MSTALSAVTVKPITDPSWGAGFAVTCDRCRDVAWSRTRSRADLEAIQHRASHQSGGGR